MDLREFLAELAESSLFSGTRHSKEWKTAAWPHDSQGNFQGTSFW